MSRWRIQVYKSLAGDPRGWSNRYFVEAPDMSTAVEAGNAIQVAEVALHCSATTIESVRTDDNTPGTDVFNIQTVGEPGTWYSNGSEQYIPLFNCVRVDIDVLGGGRPSRKYYRPPIGEGHIVNGQGDATSYVGHFEDVITGLISNVAAMGASIVDPDGQDWVTPHCLAPVAMRQRHRRRRKVTA
jgi:hypothetical protein